VASLLQDPWRSGGTALTVGDVETAQPARAGDQPASTCSPTRWTDADVDTVTALGEAVADELEDTAAAS
jgi:hypothetical protein